MVSAEDSIIVSLKNSIITKINNVVGSHNVSNIAHLDIRNSIPTTTSQLINNSGFLTSHQDISGKENISNKVTSWNSTTDNTRYPSEKLVKDSLDNKANSSHTHISSDITDLFNAIYPVGSIYISVNNTSPSTLFGGTWEQLTETFLYASTTADTNSTTATAGEATHTLTIDEMPSHNHAQQKHNHSMGDNWSGGNGSTSAIVNSSNRSRQKRHTDFQAPIIGNTGGGQAHNNMPPYMKVYMWKRTA